MQGVTAGQAGRQAGRQAGSKLAGRHACLGCGQLMWDQLSALGVRLPTGAHASACKCQHERFPTGSKGTATLQVPAQRVDKTMSLCHDVNALGILQLSPKDIQLSAQGSPEQPQPLPDPRLEPGFRIEHQP